MILCIGTTPTIQRTMIFDRLTIDDVNRSAEVHEHASGKSINVARVAKTLGQPVLAVGFAGGDRGKFLLHQLAAADIDHRFVEVTPQTRLCTTLIDRSTSQVTELVEESAEVEPDAWPHLNQILDEVIPRAAVIVCSGSLPPNGPVDLYANCIRRNPAATFIIDARGPSARMAAALGHCILKLNRDELVATTNLPAQTPDELKAAMRAALPTHGAIIVTLGKSGACALSNNQFWTIRVPVVPVISPIGSGDSFAAGLAVALQSARPFPEALRLAAACGAANAMTPRAGELHITDVHRLTHEIAVESRPL